MNMKHKKVQSQKWNQQQEVTVAINILKGPIASSVPKCTQCWAKDVGNHLPLLTNDTRLWKGHFCFMKCVMKFGSSQIRDGQLTCQLTTLVRSIDQRVIPVTTISKACDNLRLLRSVMGCLNPATDTGDHCDYLGVLLSWCNQCGLKHFCRYCTNK